MNILQVPARFHPYTGGVENYVYELSKQLVKRGHKVVVFCANEPAPSDAPEWIEGIEVNRLGCIGKIANTNITPMLPFKLLKEDYDVIHTHLPTPWSADWSAIISCLRRKKLVVTYHNDIVGRGLSKYIAKLYNMTLLQFVLKTAHKIIITQPKYLEYSPYLEKYKDKIVVVPVGVDTERFKPMKEVKKGKNVVGFLSVLDEYHKYKGLDYLLRAIAKAKEKIPDIKLMVGGCGALLPEYEKMAKDLGVAQNVEFLGFVPEENLVEFYNRLNVFVLPSTSKEQEGFGIVALEGLACGTPVVVTDVVGIAGCLEKEKNNHIIDANADDIAKKIRCVLNMPYKKNLILQKYNWSSISKKISDIYEK